MLFPVFREKGGEYSNGDIYDPTCKKIDEDSLINGITSTASSTTAGLIANQCTSNVVNQVILIGLEGGKEFTTTVLKEGVNQVVVQMAKNSGQSIVQSTIASTTNHIIQGVVQTGINTANEKLVVAFSKEAVLETFKQFGIEGTKDTTGIVITQGVVQSSKGFFGSVAGFAFSMGLSLLAQGAISIVSAIASSGWKVGPSEIPQKTALDGCKLKDKIFQCWRAQEQKIKL